MTSASGPRALPEKVRRVRESEPPQPHAIIAASAQQRRTRRTGANIPAHHASTNGVARDLLREEQDRPLTIDDVAREAAMSPFHFIRRFSAVFGDTPHQVRIKARLDRARHLLASGERSVTESCMEVGFSSHGSFSALFARRVGVSPMSSWRSNPTPIRSAGLFRRACSSRAFRRPRSRSTTSIGSIGA
jgi:AraC-like DNA-binding protein